ncbi:MAG: GNAT family N-acetyltransferase [Lachnospiraceae bacterium]|nr:GNAT family N-acetyltransferase [Lachnospiraceae bacterium]
MSEFKILPVTAEHVDDVAGMLSEEAVTALRLELPVTAFAVAEGNTVIGALSGAADGDFFEISSLYVSPDFRRRGAGTALMKTLFSLLSEPELMVRIEYAPQGDDTETLEPFLISLDFNRDTVSYPPYFTETLRKVKIDTAKLRGSREKLLSFAEAPAELLATVSEATAPAVGHEPICNLLSETIDRDNSFISLEDDEISAFVAADTGLEESFQVCAVWADVSHLNAVKEMLACAFEGLKGRYHPDTRITMLAMGPMAEEAVGFACPDARAFSYSFVKPWFEEL